MNILIYLFLFVYASGSVCRLVFIEDSPDLTSPPLPHKQRTTSTSSRGTPTGGNARGTNAMSLPPPQQQPQQQPPNSAPSTSSTGYSPYHPEQAAAYQQYLQNQNAGPGGYRS